MKEITGFQIKALIYLINKSQDTNEITKKICIALINASKGLTMPVYFTGTGVKEVMNSCDIYNMVSEDKNTNIKAVLKVAGSEFIFSYCAGCFIEGKFNINYPNHYTIWLSPIHFDEKATEITIDDKELN